MSFKMAPTRRMTAAGLGKIPATRARRSISLLTLSRGLVVDQILIQCARGRTVNARTFGLGVVHEWPELGEAVGELVAHGVPGGLDPGGIGLGEIVRNTAATHALLTLGHMGQQVADEVDSAPLVPSALEGPLPRFDQAGVLVADDQLDPAQSALLQAGEESAPEHHVLVVPDVDSEDLP